MNTWDEVIAAERGKDYYAELMAYVNTEYAINTCYPPREQIYSALHLTPLSQVRAVILGQDPYHGHGQAHGLAFSVRSGVQCPPSLHNVLRELQEDVGVKAPMNQYGPGLDGDLTGWARKGILLLNSTLTVRRWVAGSHVGRGWEHFTAAILRAVARQPRPIAFLLFGRDAQKTARGVANMWEPEVGDTETTNSDGDLVAHVRHRHVIIETPHPSPLARGFRGSKPFSRANDGLVARGVEPIDWSL